MFLHHFTAEQQIAFARAAVFAVHADGELDEREAILLDQLREELGLLELPPVPSRELIQRDLAMFSDDVSRRIFLLELAGVVTADGVRHDAELRMLAEWAEQLGEPSGTVEHYLDLSDRAHRVHRDARSLVQNGVTSPSRS